MNKKIVHDALILTAFTLILGFILGLVHEITKAPIEKAVLATEQAAYEAVFPEADSFQAYAAFDAEAADAVVAAAAYDDAIDGVQEALDASGNTMGYVVTVTANDGSQGSITFSVGIMSDGTVNGYSITNTSETPGLGIKAGDEEFYSQFQNKLVDAFSVVKQEPAADNEIEAITGATITSKAVANGVNASLVYFHYSLIF